MTEESERRHGAQSMYGRCEYMGCNEPAVTAVRLNRSSGDRVAMPLAVAGYKTTVELCRGHQDEFSADEELDLD